MNFVTSCGRPGPRVRANRDELLNFDDKPKCSLSKEESLRYITFSVGELSKPIVLTL